MSQRLEHAIKKSNERAKWYSLGKLQEIKPDFIVLGSKFYSRFTRGQGKQTYPKVSSFFDDLLNEKYSYEIIYDNKTKKSGKWIYPKNIRHVNTRIIVLKHL